ncbi:flagellar hook-associated protein FlgL [bacterium]|nr:flagellar hook-associated protein FlgL [bacterium]
MSVNRVTFSSQQLVIRDNLSRVQRQYEEASVPATTGKRINSLSDDPSVSSRLLLTRRNVASNEQFQKNITSARLRFNETDSALGTAGDILQKIRDLVLDGNNATISSGALSLISDQLQALKDDLVGEANSQVDGKYIFSGTATATQPFTGSPGIFNGNSNSLALYVNETQTTDLSLDGNEIFTGSVATATGSSLLTTLKDSSGNSFKLEAGDSISFAATIGAGTVNTTYTVTANSTLTDVATSLQTALRAAGDGTEVVTVTAGGALRVTAGATAITGLELSVSGNTDFNTAFTYSSPIAPSASANSDTLKSGSGIDIFETIDKLIEGLTNRDSTQVGVYLDDLDTGINQVLNGRAAVGLRQQRLDIIEATVNDASVRLIASLSDIEDADLDKSLSDLVTRETALRLVFSSASRILSTVSGIQLNT